MSNQQILPGGGLVHDLQWEAADPSTFRIAEYPDGTCSLQGGYRYQNGGEGGYRWRDLPVVPVNEKGEAV